MENTNEYSNHFRAFASLLHNKGYLGDFILKNADKSLTLSEGLLHNCLKAYADHLSDNNSNVKACVLETYAQYLSPSDFRQCSFYIHFNSDRGFVINRMEIHSKHPDQYQRIAIKDINDIPGKNAVLSRFRKPRPRARMSGGDFGYKRRI